MIVVVTRAAPTVNNFGIGKLGRVTFLYWLLRSQIRFKNNQDLDEECSYTYVDCGCFRNQRCAIACLSRLLKAAAGFDFTKQNFCQCVSPNNFFERLTSCSADENNLSNSMKKTDTFCCNTIVIQRFYFLYF